MNNKQFKTLFVTVGSTKFEQLINRVLKPDLLQQLHKYNYRRVILQVGNGVHDDDDLFNFKQKDFSASANEITKFHKGSVEIVAYRYKSSIREDLESADLVISHSGAGSILESLEANKKLIVVVNESLMDNHQLELAEKMFEENYLLFTNCQGLSDKIDLINNPEFSLTRYVPGTPTKFYQHLKKII